MGTHLKGPVTILLVLVSHSEGARWAGREHGGVVGHTEADGGGGSDEKAVVTGDMGSSHS